MPKLKYRSATQPPEHIETVLSLLLLHIFGIEKDLISSCSTMSQLLISVESPNKILGVETSHTHLMGYLPHHLLGQSFRKLQGPLSDQHAIGRAIIEASLRNTFMEVTDTLYELGGQERQKSICFSPCSRLPGHPICCLVTIEDDAQAPLSKFLCDRGDATSSSSELWLPLPSSASVASHAGEKSACDSTSAKSACQAAARSDLRLDGGAGGWGGGDKAWSGFGGEGGWPAWANTAVARPNHARH